MRHKGRTMLVALIAVLALTAVTASAASAAFPEFVPGSGAKFPVALEGSLASSEANFAQKDNSRWFECHGANVKGELTGAKAASLTVELGRCKNYTNGSCHSVGSAEHVVVSGTAGLDYTNKSTKQVAFVLKVSKSEFMCGNLAVWMSGNLVVPVTPVNSSTTKLGLLIHGALGVEEHMTYETEKGEVKHTVFEVGLLEEENLENDFQVEQEFSLAANKTLTISA